MVSKQYAYFKKHNKTDMINQVCLVVEKMKVSADMYKVLILFVNSEIVGGMVVCINANKEWSACNIA